MPKLCPVFDRVIIKQNKADEKIGEIFLPDGAKERPRRGKVMACGEGRRMDNGQLAPMSVKSGDEVIYASYSGMKITVDGTELVVVKEEDILAVLEA